MDFSSTEPGFPVCPFSCGPFVNFLATPFTPPRDCHRERKYRPNPTFCHSLSNVSPAHPDETRFVTPGFFRMFFKLNSPFPPDVHTLSYSHFAQLFFFSWSHGTRMPLLCPCKLSCSISLSYPPDTTLLPRPCLSNSSKQLFVKDSHYTHLW